VAGVADAPGRQGAAEAAAAVVRVAEQDLEEQVAARVAGVEEARPGRRAGVAEGRGAPRVGVAARGERRGRWRRGAGCEGFR